LRDLFLNLNSNLILNLNFKFKLVFATKIQDIIDQTALRLGKDSIGPTFEDGLS